MSNEIQNAPGLSAVLAEVRKSNMSVHSLWKLYNFINAWADDQRQQAREEQRQENTDVNEND